MSAVSSIVLEDGQATPVSHTFIPLGQKRGTDVWEWEDQAVTQPAGRARITASLTRAPAVAAGGNANGHVSRVQWTISIPTLETLGNSAAGYPPPPTVAYVTRWDGKDFILPDRSTEIERKTLRVYVKQLTDDPMFVDMLDKVIGIW